MNSNYERRIRRNKARRTKQLRRRILFCFGTLMLIMIISISFFSIQAKAESKNAVHEYKYFKSVTVNSNDSLWNYAVEYSNTDDYSKYVDEVIRMNNLHDSNIKTGMNLVIPYYSSEFIK